MGSVELYKGRNSPHWVAAHHEDTRAALASHAEQIAAQARGILAAHHGRTQRRFHNLPPPTIDVQHGKLDYYVVLTAVGPPGRAIGIEYGHEFESAEKNASGPWGRSGGLHVLGKAVSIHEVSQL